MLTKSQRKVALRVLY